MKRALLAAGVLLLLFLVWPSRLDPVAYDPPAARTVTPNQALAAAERLAEGAARGPEDAVFGPDGRLYAGMEDGAIERLTAEGKLERVASTAGRPLGLRFAPSGDLIIADAKQGLLAMTPDGKLRTLATEAGGVKFGFTDDLDVASDGTVYLSDASAKFGYGEDRLDILEGRGNGRLLRYDPRTGRTDTLLDRLAFANGVALAQDESFVLVNETGKYRILRYWLKGPKQGTSDLFADNLPGFPDGVSSNRRGTFWVALFTVRNPQMDQMHPYPFLKRVFAKLPAGLLPQPQDYGYVLGLDESGKVVADLQDPSGRRLRQVTNVEERDGYLYLGTLHDRWIGKVRRP